MHPETWRDLINECLRGHAPSQVEVYRRSWREVYPAVYGLLRNKQEAEDAMQDGYIKAFDRLKELRESESFVPWVKRICMHKALDRLRSMQRLKTWEIKERESPQTEHEVGNEWKEEQLERLKDAMEELPEGYRVVVRLYALEEMSHEEVGEMLGITASTARSQYSRALRKLREELTKSTIA